MKNEPFFNHIAHNASQALEAVLKEASPSALKSAKYYLGLSRKQFDTAPSEVREHLEEFLSTDVDKNILSARRAFLLAIQSVNEEWGREQSRMDKRMARLNRGLTPE